MHWLALWFCDPKVDGSNPVVDGQVYELSGEVALRNQQYFNYIIYFTDITGLKTMLNLFIYYVLHLTICA